MIDVQPPSNATQDATRALPYLITVAIALVGALWAAFKGKDAKLMGSLEAQLVAKDNIIKERDETIKGLGAKLDKQRDEAQAALKEEQQGRLEDARKTAKLLIQGRGGRDRPTEWDEAPTGVRELLELVVPGLSDHRRELSSLPPPPRRPPRTK